MYTKSIYENPKEYAKVCSCSLEIAEFRCKHYLELYKKSEGVHCPCCKADSSHLQIDYADGLDSTSFITCEECGASFDMSDTRLEHLVTHLSTFDDILYLTSDKASIESNWTDYVEKSTQELKDSLEKANQSLGGV